MVPFFSSLVKETVPRWASMMLFTMAMPRPVPPISEEEKNGLEDPGLHLGAHADPRVAHLRPQRAVGLPDPDAQLSAPAAWPSRRCPPG